MRLQSEKLLLFDTVQNELEEKIRRLEEDRHSIDITSGTDITTHCTIFFFHLQSNPSYCVTPSIRVVERRALREKKEARRLESRQEEEATLSGV